MSTNPYSRVAQVIADMIDAEPAPVVCGRSMYRATTCELVDAIRDESVTLGMHKAQYPFDDARVVAQAAKVAALASHLRDRIECP